MLDKLPEEQNWDIPITHTYDIYGHTGATLLSFVYIEESDWRWIEHDPVYEKMFIDMATTVNAEVREEKIQQMVQYVYDRAYALFIYSPISPYAVNKEVNFVPQKFSFLRLKETSVSDNHWSIEAKRNKLLRIKPKEEYAGYSVTANRRVFLGKSADILWSLHLTKM